MKGPFQDPHARSCCWSASLRVRIPETKGKFQRAPGICCRRGGDSHPGGCSWGGRTRSSMGLRLRSQARKDQKGRKNPLSVTLYGHVDHSDGNQSTPHLDTVWAEPLPPAGHTSLKGDKGSPHVGEEVGSQKWGHQWDQSSTGSWEHSSFGDVSTLSSIMNHPQFSVTG